MKKPIQSDLPKPGLTPVELAEDILARIERGNEYARSRKTRFRRRSVMVKLLALTLSATSTIILGLQNLNGWTGTAFALVAVVTVIGALEPFFAWRSLWVLMEEIQHRFYRLRDDVAFYVAITPADELDVAVLRAKFDEYQAIWDQVGTRWIQYRQADGAS
ncbi:SLATT domain-containing protein [Amycolatopsis sp. NPDC059657]|uniref:SLATT domain-containing protein n=1 Tax=Amycolatopsis sp. NPDC059657 TaxID=3346899 RepID=UPI00366E2EEF